MKLLYAGAPACDESTFKRLLIIGQDLCFSDRPSVTFGEIGSVGSVGTASPMRGLPKPWQEELSLKIYTPPSGPAPKLYLPYVKADLANRAFVETFVDGLTKSDKFSCVRLS